MSAETETYERRQRLELAAPWMVQFSRIHGDNGGVAYFELRREAEAAAKGHAVEHGGVSTVWKRVLRVSPMTETATFHYPVEE